MDIYIEKADKIVQIPGSMSGKELLKELSINPETVLIVQNGTVVLDTDMLDDTDEVKILSVISGG